MDINTGAQQDLMKRGVCRCGVEMLQVGFFKLFSLQFLCSSSRKDPNQSGSESGIGPHNITHNLRLDITLTSILRQKKKNYGNSNISPCNLYNLQKKSSKRNQNPPRDHNSITNLKFQHKPKYHLSKILI